MTNATFGQTLSIDAVVDGLARTFDAFPAYVQAMLREFEGAGPSAHFASQEVVSARNWLAEQTAEWVFGRIAVAGFHREVLLVLPKALLLQLVDLHFGGDGIGVNANRPLTQSERRFAQNLFENFAAMLTTALAEAGVAEVKFTGFETNPRHLHRPGKTVQSLVQKFDARASNLTECQMQFVWPVEILRRLHANMERPTASSAETKETNFEHDLRCALLQVHVPISTIFARPEIAFEDLLNLAPGDIIPIILPKKVPMSISGTVFAYGSVGESHGRAAVRIETIERD